MSGSPTVRTDFLAQDTISEVYEATIFDTALVAAIYKENPLTGAVGPAFPEALIYVLAHQQPDGGWASTIENFEVGRILNSMAGLLALLRRRAYTTNSSRGMDARISCTEDYLRSALKSWEPQVDAHLPDSLELVLELFTRLQKAGMAVQFPKKAQLKEILQKRNARSGPKNHFLVAVVPQEGGYRVQTQPHARRDCGVGCSPAKTALFLIDPEDYNEDYEIYLRSAMEVTNANGGVPAVFPVSLVEIASTLEALSQCAHSNINERSFLEERLHQTTQVSHLCLTDKCLDISAHLLIAKLFGGKNDSGTCDELERVLLNHVSLQDNRQSLDENCHVLKTLLLSPRSSQSLATISSLFGSICNSWWMGTYVTTISRSDFYALSLFISCFSQISDNSKFNPSIFNTEDLHIRGPITIVQMVAKILTTQKCNGSWGEGTRGCLEDTSLAILSLTTVLSFPFLGLLRLDIRHAIEKGHEVLLSVTATGKPLRSMNANWLSASAYRSRRLCEAYALAATNKSLVIQTTETSKESGIYKAAQSALSLATFFHGLPNLSREPFFKLKAAAIESTFYVEQLKAMRLDIFPVTNTKEKDNYFHYIPIMWCIHNSVRKAWAPPVIIWDISVIRMFIFLVDEYIESHIVSFSAKELAELSAGIQQIFALEGDWATEIQNLVTPGKDIKKRTSNPLVILNPPSSSESFSPLVMGALDVFYRWGTFQMNYPSLQLASALDLHALRFESKNYLLYHLHQTADNQRLASQISFSPSIPFRSPSMGYAPWLHVIGGGHIAATIALVWVQACMGHKIRGPCRDCFSNVKQKCMIWNVNTHSAKQLRMFNDYGSITRDAEERNLNSTNFPEFFGAGDAEWLHVNGAEKDAEFGVLQRKAMLLEAAQYERVKTNEELEGLYQELRAEGRKGDRIAEWFGLYLAGGDQFSDMYLYRDVTNSTK